MGVREKKKKRVATCAGILLAEAILQQKQNTWRSILLGEGILLSDVDRSFRLQKETGKRGIWFVTGIVMEKMRKNKRVLVF